MLKRNEHKQKMVLRKQKRTADWVVKDPSYQEILYLCGVLKEGNPHDENYERLPIFEDFDEGGYSEITI